ncbi:Transcriptional regulator, AraC family [Paraburkholderia sacchari]|uniref:AraC family transcriptional regulator n=1 Tax=Paraburkholderia sacchari TaxID=159450 RepID=UPI0039A68CE8
MNTVARPLVPARYFLLLRDSLRAAGSSLEDLLSAAGIDPHSVRQPDSGLSIEQVESLIAHALRITGRSDLGFDWGRRLRLNSHDLLGYAMLSCTTVDQLLGLSARYYGLIAPMYRMEYQRTGDRAVIIFRPAVPMKSETLHLLQEVIAVSTHFQCIPLLSNPRPVYDIYMSMEEPPHVRRYRELAPARVHFSASTLPEVRIVTDTWSLDSPLPMADEYAVRMAEERCKAQLQRYRERGNWTDWVIMMLNEAEDSQPTLEELAGLIGTSGRSLERYLKKEGSGYRDLAVQVRSDRARKMLLEGDMPVSQIAYRLGFTDLANFTRAFRRENGVSPSEFRRAPKTG